MPRPGGRSLTYLQLMQTVVVTLKNHPVQDLQEADPGEVLQGPRLVLQGREGSRSGGRPAQLPAVDAAPGSGASPQQHSERRPRSHCRSRNGKHAAPVTSKFLAEQGGAEPG